MKLPEIDILLCGDWKKKLENRTTLPRLVLVYELEYHPTEWGYTVVNREKIPVPENTVTFNRAGDIRYLISEKEEVETQFLYFGIVSDSEGVLTQAISRIPYVGVASEAFREKWQQLRWLYQKSSETAAEEKAEIDMKAALILMDILFLLAGDSSKERQPTAYSSAHQKALLRAICYMKENLNRNCPVQEIADQAGYSVSHFNYLFKQYTRRTPHGYCQQLKLQEARIQLLTTDRKIGEISESLAFCSASEFGVAFKAEYGVTPMQYRKIYE